MISGTTSESPTGSYRLLIRPNQSMSVQTMIGVLSSFGLVMLCIGLWFIWQGMWLVLPIAGLEFVVLVLAFFVTTRKARDFDMVIVDDEFVRVTRVVNGVETNHKFMCCWSQVKLQQPNRHWMPARLMIGSHGEWIEIGRSMTEPARRALSQELRAHLARVPAEQAAHRSENHEQPA